MGMQIMSGVVCGFYSVVWVTVVGWCIYNGVYYNNVTGTEMSGGLCVYVSEWLGSGGVSYVTVTGWVSGWIAVLQCLEMKSEQNNLLMN